MIGIFISAADVCAPGNPGDCTHYVRKEIRSSDVFSGQKDIHGVPLMLTADQAERIQSFSTQNEWPAPQWTAERHEL